MSTTTTTARWIVAENGLAAIGRAYNVQCAEGADHWVRESASGRLVLCDTCGHTVARRVQDEKAPTPEPTPEPTDGHEARLDIYAARTAFSDPQYKVRAFTTTSQLQGAYDVLRGLTITYSRRDAAEAIRVARLRGLFVEVTFTYSKGERWNQAEWDLS
jgi:hypothetical protein